MKCGGVFWTLLKQALIVCIVVLACPGLLAQPVTYFGVTFPMGDLAFADRVVEYVPASCVRAAYADPERALGPPDARRGQGCYGCDSCDVNAVSLGFRLSEIDDRGYLILEFVDNVLMDVPGDDLFIFNTRNHPARVEISANGHSFLFVGEVVGYPGAIDIGPYVSSSDEFRFVRISAVPGGDDRSDCPGPSIDAVGAMGKARTPDPDPVSPPPETVITGEAFGSLSLLPVGDLAITLDAAGRNVFILLDISSSMRQRIAGNEVKMDVAKSVLIELIDRLPEGNIVSVRTFGGMCETELVAPATVADEAALRDAIRAIEPTGFTPIAMAIDATRSELERAEGPSLVLLISDGEETCGGDPVQSARALVDQGHDLMIHVVGFDVTGGDGRAQAQLIEIAETSGGIYVSADSTEELRQALGLTDQIRLPYTVYDEAGDLVYRGMLGEPGQRLEAGVYRIEIDTPLERIVLSDVVIRAEQITTVRLGRSNGQYEAEIGE